MAQARAKGPLSIPAAGDHLPATWGTKVPESLYGQLEKLGSRTIPRHSADGAPVVVFLALPARTPEAGARTTHEFGNCVLTVIGYQYPDHWEYAYSYLSGNCFFDSGSGGGGGGGGGTVGPPSSTIPNCPMPSGADGTIAGTAINGNSRLKDLAIFLANNRTSPSISVNTTDQPTKGNVPVGQGVTGIDAKSDYGATPALGHITLFSKALTASGHPVEQVLYHELLHYYFGFAQYDFGGDNATSVLPQGGTATATIGGVTYTYDLTDHKADGGYQSYEHVLVHNALVEAFGSDQTGALMEALSKTSPPLTDNEKTAIIAAYKNANVPGSISGTIPKDQTCGVTKYPSSRVRSVQSASRATRDLITDMAGITFDETYIIGVPASTPPPRPAGCTAVDSYGYCGWYSYLSTGTCDPGDPNSPLFVQNWTYTVWNAYSGQTTWYMGNSNVGGGCLVYPSWQPSPQTVTSDPYLPGPYDYPTV